ncbi:MAG: NAD(P)H-binding protein [Micromonosporaceae bacterium]|nr:NAD(P)H-binding protein [Micromonosporaceae bacterium]
MSRVAILGATGYLGGYAVRRFMSDGHDVRAIVRSPGTASFPEGVEVVRGDVTDPATLPPALERVEGVLMCLNGGGDPARARSVEEQGGANVAAAAGNAGVQRIVLISGMFAQPAYAAYPWEQAKVRGEQHLNDSPVPSTVFRVGFVNETLSRFLRGNRPVLIGRQPHLVRPIAVDDIMSAASRAFGMPETANRVYDVGGDEPMTMREAVAAYASAVTGRRISPAAVRSVPIWLMRGVNRLFAKGEMTRALGILSTMNRHGDVTDTAAWFQDFGKPPTPFAQWVAQQSRIEESS